MAETGLSTPLHLAASLLACFASGGLAIIVLARPGALHLATPRHAGDRILALGALLFAVGHGLAGGIVGNTEEIVPWLYAVGLLLMATGLSRPQLRGLAGAGIVVPLEPAPAAVIVALTGAVVGAGRAFIAGRHAWPLGVGLLAWGAALPVAQRTASGGALLDLLGAAAVGWWLWRLSARALRAKFVTASITLLLAVVVLIAAALSDLGSRDLVDSELRRLTGLGATVAADVSGQWLVDAADAASILRSQGPSLLRTARADQLEGIYRAFFRGQDQEFLVVLDERGRVVGSHAPGGKLSNSFLLQLQGAELVEKILRRGEPRAASLLSIGGEFVAAGGVPLTSASARPEDAPLGVVVTGRRADAAWAARVQRQIGTDVIVAVGTDSTVSSAGISEIADEIAAALDSTRPRAALNVAGQPVYAAVSNIEDPEIGGTVGRVVAVSEAQALAETQRKQAQRLFVLALLGALLSGAAAALISGRLVAPIRRLTDVAAAVREGNLDVDVDIGSADEVGVLGRTFDEMTTSLSTQATQLRDAAGVQARLRARLEALTSSMSDGLVAVNPDGKVVTFNPAAQRLVGRDITDVLGLPLDQVLFGHAPGEESVADAIGAFDSEETVAAQVLLERSDGRLVPTAVNAAPVHDIAGGRVLGRVLVLRDVTREAEIERMKTEFLSNVSHELRTPLTPIKGYAEVLARRDVGPEATRSFAAQILDSTGRLERIVATIVDFAALDSGRLDLQPEHVVVGDLADEVLAAWRRQHPGREFRRRVERTTPPAFVDALMLRRCLDELVDNAVKFSPDGGPITLLASHVATDRDYVRLSIRDQGVGIDPEVAARIFSDFFQADASETRHYGGLGLGLALVRRIIEAMDGHVDVDSSAGGGSTFHLLVPVSTADPAVGAAPAED